VSTSVATGATTTVLTTATPVATTARPSTTAAVPAPTTVPETVVLPSMAVPSTAPATTPPPTAPSTVEPATTAATTARVTWGGWDFYVVPQLGSEPVRGSGCGGNGSLPAVIPDGIWHVFIGDRSSTDNSAWSASTIQLDVSCVYYGASGQQMLDAACAADPGSGGCEDQDPDFYLVNASTRLRPMPVSPGVRYGVGGLGAKASNCASQDPRSADAPWHYMDSWVVIDGGIVTDVITACPAG
jgi:hypothetical protein